VTAGEKQTMSTPSLQDAIDRAGSPVRLIWKPNAKSWTPPGIQPEYAGWRVEQAAPTQGVAISDLSHHMYDTFIEGPDATRLLSAVSANDFQSFAVGQAKQFIPVTEDGHIVTDGILMRAGPEKYTLSGVPAAQNWVRYQAKKNGYDVSLQVDPDSAVRKDKDPVLFRYQVQGPRALELVEKVFGGPLPKTKFFHSAPINLAGRTFHALRHGMAGQPGYEFIGNWADGRFIKDALMEAGQEFGLIHVGAMAYATNGIESGWVPTPTPAIYTGSQLEEYRRFLSLYSYEGQKPLHGSFFSDNIEDYYCSPYELGYGKLIAFNHDFIGRAALEKAKDLVKRTKVTLVLNKDDVREVFGADPGYVLSYGRYRVEAESTLVGLTFYTGYIDPLQTILSLALINKQYAEPGTNVCLIWGEHPGPGKSAIAEQAFARLRATVQVAPYNDYARTSYRRNP
jgi:vanillate/3-O-methylgallate O-demethylase